MPKCKSCNKNRVTKEELCRYCLPKCKTCGKNPQKKDELCAVCLPKCKNCNKNQPQKQGLCSACLPKCKVCNKKQGQRDGYCKKCHPSLKCKSCTKNIAIKDNLCKSCHPDKCKICRKNNIHRQGFCLSCDPQYRCKLCSLYTVTKLKTVKSTLEKVRLCEDCFYKSYPNERIPRRFKRKQNYIHDKLVDSYGENFFEYDKRIEGGCSSRKPDWFKDCITHSIIIECDEDRHENNSTICEHKRLMILFEDLGNRPIVFIRFNPDKYGNTKGCFTFDDLNNVICDEEEFSKRFEKLKGVINDNIVNIPQKEVDVIKLFY